MQTDTAVSHAAHGPFDTSVLVAGAGPSGLITCLLLARHGVRSTLVERRAAPSILPRALGINLRSMEIFRMLGMTAEIRRASRDVQGLPFLVDMDTLRGPVRETIPFQAAGEIDATEPPSPEHFTFCAQNQLEPLLQSELSQSGMCEILVGWELIGLEQDKAGVTAHLREKSTSRDHSISAAFVVGADGAHSTVRETVGVEMQGHDHLTHELNILVDADLTRALGGLRSLLYQVRHPWLPGPCLFRNVDGRNRWSVVCERFEDASPERCTELMRLCAGDPSLDVDVLAIGEWERAAVLADRFRVGRVFLVGDAAHRVTPAGAFGMNSGIQDAHNLAWKLAAVLNGWAGYGLLDTYESERRPWTAMTVDLSYRLTGQHRRGAARTLGHVIGQAYEVGAFVPDGTPPPDVPDPIADYVPSARPGRRAPHRWLIVDGHRTSTLDLFDGRLVLLSPSEFWCAAARDVASELRLPMQAHAIADSAWADLYQVGPLGAVLVRPDGHVAWRTRDSLKDRSAALRGALSRVLDLCGEEVDR